MNDDWLLSEKNPDQIPFTCQSIGQLAETTERQGQTEPYHEPNESSQSFIH